MKIAIYWEQNSWGGVDAHLLTLLKSWPNTEDTIVLFYNKGNLGLERIRIDLEKLTYIRLAEISSCSYNEVVNRLAAVPLGRFIRGLVYFLQPLLFFYMVVRLTRQFRNEGGIDVVLADNGGYPGAWGCLSSLIAAKRAHIGVRILLVHHEAVRPGFLMSGLDFYADRMVTRTASAIVCPSYATCRTILERRAINSNLIRTRVIYNEVVENTDNIASEKGANIRAIVGDDSEVLIGIVGRVESYKGHEDIISAVSRLNKSERKRIRLVVVGSGEQNEVSKLQRLAERLGVGSRVNFLGYVAGSSVALIKQLDLLIVATRSFEGFGLTLAEAMLVEIPIVTTNVGAIPEFVDSSVGTLIPPNSPRDLSEVLSAFLTNPTSFKSKLKKAKARIQETGSGMASEYRRLFIECNET